MSTDTQSADLAEVILGIARELRLRIDADPDHLTLSESHVMRYINHRPGVAPSDVARHTGLQRSNVSTALRALEKRGLLERRSDPADARAVRLFPTERATVDLARLRRQWSGQICAALGDATARVGDVLAVLDRLETALVADRLGPAAALPSGAGPRTRTS